MSRDCQSSSKRLRYSYDDQCYSCRGYGHLQRDCPTDVRDCYKCGGTVSTAPAPPLTAAAILQFQIDISMGRLYYKGVLRLAVCTQKLYSTSFTFIHLQIFSFLFFHQVINWVVKLHFKYPRAIYRRTALTPTKGMAEEGTRGEMMAATIVGNQVMTNSQNLG